MPNDTILASQLRDLEKSRDAEKIFAARWYDLHDDVVALNPTTRKPKESLSQLYARALEDAKRFGHHLDLGAEFFLKINGGVYSRTLDKSDKTLIG